MSARRAFHAGSWYSDNGRILSTQLDGLLANVPDTLEHVGSLPISGARVVIAPHAGYAYSGPCAAYAYKALDLTKAKRIFILGPSHHHYLTTLAVPQVKYYYTPLSDDPLPLDLDVIAQLQQTKSNFATMSRSVDEEEHSIEMHLPYIHRLLQLQYPDTPTAEYPPLVPIMVGNTSASTEKAAGAILAPYLADPENVFVVSSDFCHWGLRFRYTYYVPQAPTPGPELPLSSDGLPQPGQAEDQITETISSVCAGHELRRGERTSRNEPAIHESISAFDLATMSAITTGSAKTFLDTIERTGNTVCGRHPICVIMAALEVINATRSEEAQSLFHFLRYERSTDAVDVSDSSVSYVSAVAAL
ncbi:hypothetical protein N7478_003443 [Penicillium angulare]|uniref:uncharacterized protein n=1 Tax=Penicillium angulare TaxID=116970 RepID=UPI0025400B47|nr:uncharacterized protein N7478_003443 [Penicillium angulare]KAJ5287757.1 hypothetical protein N7478_003443 [Penicillium angulare]